MNSNNNNNNNNNNTMHDQIRSTLLLQTLTGDMAFSHIHVRNNFELVNVCFHKAHSLRGLTKPSCSSFVLTSKQACVYHRNSCSFNEGKGESSPVV